MLDRIAPEISNLAQQPVFQGVLAALSTFILEDPTTVGCGLLVADGKMLFVTALVGVSMGIALGDLGLYWLGRFVGPRTMSWGLVSPARMERTKNLFDRNLVVAIVVSRFVPGMRLPTYLGAGLFGASAMRFVIVALSASLVWTFLLLSATLKFGEAVLPLLGQLKWPVVIGFLMLLVLVRKLAARTLSDEVEGKGFEEPVCSFFEFWPPHLFYLPVGLYYSWLAIRHCSFTLPTAANPAIHTGGLIGESKSQILSLVGPEMRGWVSPWFVFSNTGGNAAGEDVLERAREALARHSFDYPFVVKPDQGQRGAGVRVVWNETELSLYLKRFPTEERLLFQELADYPQEMGVLYFRFPGESRGRIFSITLKEFPSVLGDGKKTLRELILSDARARIIRNVYFERHRNLLDTVLSEGERFQLVFAGNHCQGAVFRDGNHLVNTALLDVVEGIVSTMPEFYFGRLDIRYRELDDLLQGREFRVIEINGAGGEATHIWDPNMSLLDAYSTLFRQFRILFEIGARNRQKGFKTVAATELLKIIWRYSRLARSYPPSS
jgi:membrane protein DedA with SNARE-associated domain